MVVRSAYLALGGALVLAVTACTAPPVANVDPVPSVATATAAALPLDEYWPDLDEEAMLNGAKKNIAAQCVREFGFGESDVPDYPLSAIAFSRLRRAQLVDREVVARHGYHYEEYPAAQPSDSSHTSPPPPPRSVATNPAAAEIFAGRVQQYRGKPVPAGGCRAAAERALAEGAPWPGQVDTPRGKSVVDNEHSLQNFILSLRHQAHETSHQDPRLRESAARWSACMKSKGFDHRSPADVTEDPRWNTDEVSALERRTALADLHCRLETGYQRTQETLQAGHERRLIEQASNIMLVIKRNQEIRIGNASRLGAGG